MGVARKTPLVSRLYTVGPALPSPPLLAFEPRSAALARGAAPALHLAEPLRMNRGLHTKCVFDPALSTAKLTKAAHRG